MAPSSVLRCITVVCTPRCSPQRAAANAQKQTGKTDITSADMRDGMESLQVSAARLAELGLPGFAPEISVTCENHGGRVWVAIQQWDASAKKWSLITDFVASDREVL